MLLKEVKYFLKSSLAQMNKYIHNSSIFYKKYIKGKRGTQRVNFYKNNGFFIKFWLFHKILNFTLFILFSLIQKVSYLCFIAHKYHVNRSKSVKIMKNKLKFGWQETTNFVHKFWSVHSTASLLWICNIFHFFFCS